MARTGTPDIRIDRNGWRITDKEHRGVGIYLRLGSMNQENAEQRLAASTFPALLRGCVLFLQTIRSHLPRAAVL
jgi:hypothetical protein